MPSPCASQPTIVPWRRLPALGVLTVAAVAGAAPAAQAAPSATVVGTFERGATVSAAGNIVALGLVSDAAGTSRTLLVGVDGALPAPAVGVGPLPPWARPQVGTDAAGHAVVVYPRCGTADVTTCDLYAYDVAAHSEAPIPGTDGGQTAELDGAMEHGVVAFNRWTPSGSASTPSYDAQTRLYIKPVGRHARQLTKKGGRALTLHGSRIVQVRDSRGEGADIGNATISVELVSTKTGGRTTVRRSFMGESGQHPTGATIFGGQVVWASSWSDRAAQLWRYDIARRQRTKISMPSRLFAFSPTSTSGGIGMRWALSPSTPTSEESELVQIAGVGPGVKTRG